MLQHNSIIFMHTFDDRVSLNMKPSFHSFWKCKCTDWCLLWDCFNALPIYLFEKQSSIYYVAWTFEVNIFYRCTTVVSCNLSSNTLFTILISRCNSIGGMIISLRVWEKWKRSAHICLQILKNLLSPKQAYLLFLIVVSLEFFSMQFCFLSTQTCVCTNLSQMHYSLSLLIFLQTHCLLF